MKTWHKLVLVFSILSLMATAAIFLIDYQNDRKVISAVKKLLEQKKVIELQYNTKRAENADFCALFFKKNFTKNYFTW